MMRVVVILQGIMGNMELLKVTYFVILSTYVVTATAVEYSQSSEGYSVGFVSDCPDSWKPADIRPESLKKLTISVIRRNNAWTTYNYHQMRNLAKHNTLDFKKKTFMYVGGYWNLNTVSVGRFIGNMYRKLGYNVLVLDYMAFVARDFPINARLMRPIGKHAAEMLAELTTLGLDPKKLELLGYSLGAQTMSFIAKNYREITGRNISSLTALDPAGPCFRHLGPDQRLDSSDADFVLSMVTNMDVFGMALPSGHVTFYVNGGEFQPGDVWWLPCDTSCSHLRAYFLWMSALINPGIFIGLQCDSVQQARDSDCYERKPKVTNTMDLNADRSRPGVYYLHTFHRYPYGLGQRALKRSGEFILKQLGSLNTDGELWV